MKSNFIVSIDFELIWGMHEGDIVNSSYSENIKGGRRAIPELLKLFEKYGIHATWAVVGLMFANNVDEARKYFPSENMQPTYNNINMSPYPLIKSIDKPETDNALYFAPDVIEQIAKTNGQEIASHTFSHFYCREKGQTVEQFEADMIAAKAIALDKGYELKTVVLPRDQCVREYIDVLSKLGFIAYRDDYNDWIHKKIKIRPLLRVMRMIDTYFPITGFGGYVPSIDNGIYRLISSRMFRPYFKPLAFMEKIKTKRIKKQMLHAAKKGLTFHLWWHPHNIGAMTKYHLETIEEILSYYDFLKKQYGMQSKNMAEVAEMLEKL